MFSGWHLHFYFFSFLTKELVQGSERELNELRTGFTCRIPRLDLSSLLVETPMYRAQSSAKLCQNGLQNKQTKTTTKE